MHQKTVLIHQKILDIYFHPYLFFFKSVFAEYNNPTVNKVINIPKINGPNTYGKTIIVQIELKINRNSLT